MMLENVTSPTSGHPTVTQSAPVKTKTTVSSAARPRAQVATVTLLTNARILMSHGETPLALNLLREAANRESTNPAVLSTLAEALEGVSKFGEAVKVRAALAKLHPSFATAYGYAQALYRTGDDEAAQGQYYEALSMMEDESPELFEIHKNMGNIFVRRGDFEAAEESYNKAYCLKPGSDVLLVNLGTLEVQRGDLEKARHCFRRAVEANASNDKAWTGLAMVHNDFGDFDLAWGNLERAIDLAPGNRTAIYLCAHWALRDKQAARAIPAVQSFISSEEADEDMSLALIHLFCSSGQVELARFEIERMIAWNPGRADLHQLRRELAGSQEVPA